MISHEYPTKTDRRKGDRRKLDTEKRMEAAPKLYRPSGTMCINCRHVDRDCSHLDFEKMPIIARDMHKSVVVTQVVKCSEFERINL